jgi:hypothetical protein
MSFVETRFFFCEICCLLGAVVPVAAELIHLRRCSLRNRTFAGPWLLSVGFVCFAAGIEVMRQTVGNRPVYGFVAPWLDGLFVVGVACFVLGLKSFFAARAGATDLNVST